MTDPRLTLDLVEGHLAGLGGAYLFDELTPLLRRLHTGRRGIFAYGWQEWAVAYAGFMRGPASPTWRPRPSWPASRSRWPWWGPGAPAT